MRAIITCLIVVAVTGNVLTSTVMAQGSNAAVRLNLPGGGADLICLDSGISVSVEGTDLLLRAAAMQNDLGCPAGATAPAIAAAHAGQTNLRGATNTRAVLRLDLPGGGSIDKCLQLDSNANILDQSAFIHAQALQDDGGCPPLSVVTLNDFQITPTTLNIADGASNCMIGGLPRQCLTLS